MYCSRKFDRFTGDYSTPDGPLSCGALGQDEGWFRLRMCAKILKQHTFFVSTEPRLVRKRRLKMVGNSGKSSTAGPDYLGISDPPSSRACWPENREKQHYYSNFARAPHRLCLGVDRCRRHSADVARTGAVERLSTAPV